MTTLQLAQWASNLSFSALPESAVQAAIKSFYNYVSVAIGGHDHEAIQIALKSSLPFAATSGACSLLGSDCTTHPLQAALINGFATHIHDYDDTHLATVIHPTAPVASALIAYVEYASSQGTSISGQEFILALIAGMEIECILGLSVYLSHYDVGWHITGTVGDTGAAVAVGKAMMLPVQQLQHAIGPESAAKVSNALWDIKAMLYCLGNSRSKYSTTDYHVRSRSLRLRRCRSKNVKTQCLYQV